MKPEDILEIIREAQRQQDRTIADLKERTRVKSSSAAQPRDHKINHRGKPSAVKAKKEGSSGT
jgi:hypothetical protein